MLLNNITIELVNTLKSVFLGFTGLTVTGLGFLNLSKSPLGSALWQNV